MLETHWQKTNKEQFPAKTKKAKEAKRVKPVSEEDKLKCEVRRRREALEEEIRINKEFNGYE